MDTNIMSKVQIYCSARSLPGHGLLQRVLNPILYMDIFDGRSSDAECIGHSEVIKANADPDFEQEFVVDYFFEENQVLLISIYHSDNLEIKAADRKRPHEKHKIGHTELTLSDVVSSPQGVIKTRLFGKNGEVKDKNGKCAQVITKCEVVTGLNDNITLQLEGRHLDKVHCFSKAFPVLEIKRLQGDGSWHIVHRTEVQSRTTNPLWEPFTLKIHKLCNNDEKRPLQITVSDFKSGKTTILGECKTTLHELVSMAHKHADLGTVDETVSEATVLPAERSLFLTNPNAAKKKGGRYRNSGFILVREAKRFQEAAFLDYLLGGLNVRLAIAIDFTASNGDPQFPDSLHYLDPKGRVQNPYERAIGAIAGIVGAYDTDQMFPVWGFGAKLRSTGKVSHRFPLTFDDTNEEVKGVEGILKAYRKAFPAIQLSGPTMFSEIISKASESAAQPFSETSQHYDILLIITDGVVNDKMLTIGKIIEASKLPLSIIIVGVGKADFTDMQILDADEAILEQNGKKAERDIVQFVPMENFRASETSRLATEVLKEVPYQVVSFMKARKFEPRARPKFKRTPSAVDLLFSGDSKTNTSGATDQSPAMQHALQLSSMAKPKLQLALQRARKNLEKNQGSLKRKDNSMKESLLAGNSTSSHHQAPQMSRLKSAPQSSGAMPRSPRGSSTPHQVPQMSRLKSTPQGSGAKPGVPKRSSIPHSASQHQHIAGHHHGQVGLARGQHGSQRITPQPRRPTDTKRYSHQRLLHK